MLTAAINPLPSPTRHALEQWQSHQAFNQPPQALPQFIQAIQQKWPKPHGDLACWQQAINRLHQQVYQGRLIIADTIKLQTTIAIADLLKPLQPLLMRLHPWRKGPWQFGDTFIDSEWRSQLKWQRILETDIQLTNKHILDIGCGNGYYAFRMMQQGAKSVIGVDSSLLMHFQFQLFKQYALELPICLLPIRFEALPKALNPFDVIFSMGVLYHQKDPLQHLKAIYQRLVAGGYLMLETLIINAHQGTGLIPQNRYAKMANVYLIPTIRELHNWLQQVGFKPEAQCINQTSLEEQRATAWMTNQSLSDFLSEDAQQTIEGYPPPTRILIKAVKNN